MPNSAQRIAPWAVFALAAILSCTGPPTPVVPADGVSTEVEGDVRRPKPTPTPRPTPTPTATPTATPTPDPTTTPNATPTPTSTPTPTPTPTSTPSPTQTPKGGGVQAVGQLDVQDGEVVDTTAPESIGVAR